MKNKILVLIVIMLSVVLIFEVNNRSSKIIEKNIIMDEEEVDNSQLENYIIGVVAAEMPASFFDEALKAQAVAARTIAVYNIENNIVDINTLENITDQAYISEVQMHEKWGNDYDMYYKKIKNAVDNTKGEYLIYGEKVIKSYYFAMSNGKTENSMNVFNEDLPYIKSIESRWDNSTLNNYEVTFEITNEDFLNKLNLNCTDITVTNVVIDSSNRVDSINICNKKFSGLYVRKIFNLRSTDFDINIGNLIEIRTRGYGHGVGMSQYGANGMAKEGYNYKDILNYYYADIEIQKL